MIVYKARCIEPLDITARFTLQLNRGAWSGSGCPIWFVRRYKGPSGLLEASRDGEPIEVRPGSQARKPLLVAPRALFRLIAVS